MSDEPAEIVARVLERAGLAPGAVVLADAAPDAPPPPEGPWTVVHAGAQWVVGGMGRGKFAAYEGLWTVTDALDLAVRLAADPLPPRLSQVTPEETVRGSETASAIRERSSARDGAPGAPGLVPGDLLDVIGPETGHHAYALGTLFSERSQPPSDVGAEYRTFEVVTHLPDAVREGVAAPWFGQPGGGAMVVFDRPLRWYVDQGFITVMQES